MATYRSWHYTPSGHVIEHSFEWPPVGEVKVQKPVETATTSTGLVSLDDFKAEARKAGVATKEILAKFDTWFDRKEAGEVGEGMARMQCGMLLKNAIRKKEKQNA